MSTTNKGSRDVVIFLLATSCLIAVTVGGLMGRIKLRTSFLYQENSFHV